jgi:osmoprotectant transport system ATP-binding protein
VALLSIGAKVEQYAPPAELLARPATPAVSAFLGEARMVRRLGLIKLRDVSLRSPNGATPQTHVDAGATLRDALDAVLRSSDGRAAVTDGDHVVGVVDGDVIRKASQ